MHIIIYKVCKSNEVGRYIPNNTNTHIHSDVNNPSVTCDCNE